MNACVGGEKHKGSVMKVETIVIDTERTVVELVNMSMESQPICDNIAKSQRKTDKVLGEKTQHDELHSLQLSSFVCKEKYSRYCIL